MHSQTWQSRKGPLGRKGSSGLRSEFCALKKERRHPLEMTSLNFERKSEPFQVPYVPPIGKSSKPKGRGEGRAVKNGPAPVPVGGRKGPKDTSQIIL